MYLNKNYLLYSFNYFFYETDQISIIMNYLRKYFTRYTTLIQEHEERYIDFKCERSPESMT